MQQDSKFLDVFPPKDNKEFKGLIKLQPIQEWIEWVNNELTPPIKVNDEVKYVLEAFKEALEYINASHY